MISFAKLALLAVTLTAIPVPSLASEAEDIVTPAQQFALIQSWEGRWQVAETTALSIVFEKTARGTAMIERWETSAGLHSMTVYHMDGERLVATHYCPQGNQPRLESRGGNGDEVRFAFVDVTGLDDGESHAHDLWFRPGPDATVRRFEVYRGEQELQEPGSYTLSRVIGGN